MLKLYIEKDACSLAPHIVLHETGLPFAAVRVSTATHKTEHGVDFYTLNPKGLVPLLELDNGEFLSEGPVIAQYIADRAGNTSLMPAAGDPARYRVMEWQNYITSELHKSFAPLFDHPSVDASAKAVFAAALQKKFAWVSSCLEGRPYLTGDRFTAADAYLFVVARWAPFVKLDLSAHRHLQAFMARVEARPAVQAAMKAEALTKG